MRRSILIGATALCWLLLPSMASAAEGADLLEQGRRSARAGELASALQAFAAYKQQYPDDFRPYLYSGIELAKAGRERDAALELNDAASRGLEGGPEVVEYARARIQLGDLREAARPLVELEASGQLPAEGLWLLADIHYRLKQAPEAKQVLDKFARLQPNDPRLNLRRGQVYIYLEQYEKALTAIEEAVWAAPDSPERHFEMARTLYYGINFEAAKTAALKAVQLAPGNAEYLHLLGIICDRLEQYDEAVKYLEQAAASPQAFNRIYFDLGNALRKAGERERTREVLQKYRDLHNQSEEQANREKTIEALVNQGRLQIQDGDIGAGRESLLRVLQLDPDHWLIHSLLTKIYLSSGRPDLARPHVQKLVEIDPQSSEGHYLAGMYWYQKRDLAKALTHALKSKQLRPGDAEVHNLLGNIYFGQGQLEEAAEEYAAAVGLAPDRLDFQANHRTVERKLNP
ncbi:MAG TPA: tetratricopeptide repeat protein [Acidobacteriota bacterium]|nr:tetratricopeptide repeat protein [Acidobacteriota bacterium]